jgi:predicted Na+-dependent transporter
MMIAAILKISLLLLLPQLAGLALTRFLRSASTSSSSWAAWPAAAISVFGVVFYWFVWVPAREAAEQSQSHCGNWSLALGFVLLLGLFVHLGVGVLGGLLARRPQGTTRQQ